ncbi:uncharacterized protein LOC111357469 isoform X1 [Spodoptera litura]|uniref:Uncharacterized protein LOC111357469 isoform X1 n=1 Tax=Spodoptera litura TaxID=69820 RepID=A0A9J7IYK7_SPOLT|nr:uncharacterized protein LOC111357469 isoform X1 [Spodoptera litura]
MCSVIPPLFKKVDVSCSCTNCDSVFCTAKENEVKSCSCEDCSGSKTCMFYSSVALYGSHSDATNARSCSRTLPNVVSDVARYIATSVAHLVSPQTINSSCCAATSPTTTTTTNDTGTNTIELYRKLNSQCSRNKLERLKKAYLSHKKEPSPPALACDANVCQIEQQDFTSKKTVPNDRTMGIYRTEILKQKLAAEAVKSIYVPDLASNKKPEEPNCHSDKCSKCMLQKLTGYIKDLHKNNQIDEVPQNKPIKPAKKGSENFDFTHILDSNWNTIETPGYQYAHKSQNCECIDCVEKKEEKDATHVFMFDPPGYILDLPKIQLSQKYIPHSTSCSCEGEKSKVPNICTNVSDTAQKEKCVCVAKKMSGSQHGSQCESDAKCVTQKLEKPESKIKCTDSKNSNVDAAGHAMDEPTNDVPIKTSVDKLKENCFNNSTFCSYHVEEQKSTQKIEQKKPETESKDTDQSPLYSKDMNIKNTQDLNQVKLETLQEVSKKDICECNVTGKVMNESSGYVLELEQYKPTKNAQDLVKDVLVTQENVVTELPDMDMLKKKLCECKAKPKSKFEPSGYVFDVPKSIPKQKGCDVVSNQKCNEIVCNDKKSWGSGTSKTKIELPGYVVKQIITPEKKKCECSEPPKLIGFSFESPKVVHCVNMEHRDVCRCSESDKNQRAFNENNTNMNCKCKATAKCKSSGFMLDLPTYKPCPSARKDSCGCKGLDKNRTGSYGNMFDFPKTTQKSCKCPESTKNTFDVNRLEMPSKNSNKNNEGCVCKGTAKCRQSSTPGYVVELPTNKSDGCACPKPPKPTMAENKCECNDACRNIASSNQEGFNNKDLEELAAKCKDKRSGYIFDLPVTKPQKGSCECREAKEKVNQPICMPKPIPPKGNCECSEPENKEDLSKYVYVLPKHKPQTSCCKCCPQMTQQKPIPETKKSTCECREAKNKVDQPTCMPKPKKNCDCPEPENKVDLSKYVYVLPKPPSTSKTVIKCDCGQSKNKINAEPNQPMCTPKPITPKVKCQCPRESVSCKSKPITQLDPCECPSKTKELAMDSSGYVLDLKPSKKKSCVCTPSEQNKSDLAGYVLELPRYKRTDHKPDKCECTAKKKSASKASQVYRIETTVISPETQNVCNNMLGKQSDTNELLKKFSSPRPTLKKHTDLCKNILKTQTEAIEILKKIYLPHKEVPKSPANSDEPNENLNLSSDDKTTVTCPKECQMTETEADEAAHLLGTAMLSAEVMNMPYTEFNDSLAPKQSDMEKPTKLSKYDIFKRIKEAYKACSCKVCECIAGKVKAEACNCKPCECNECLSYINQTETKTSNNGMGINRKYQCHRCITNKRLRTEHGTSNQQICDCKPCDCVECAKVIAKLCDCEPCQCVECKTRSIHQRQTLVVAPVGREENVQRLACTCSPCDCIECGLVHSLPSNVMHEMSTGTNRHALCRCDICLNEVCDQHGVDSCSCQRRNKVMSKPVEKSTHDFDIRTATTNYNKPLYTRRRKKSSTHDTIAMYAAVPTNYHALTSNDDISSNDQMCNCDECECLHCICQNEAVMNIKSSQLFSSFRTITKSDLNVPSKSILNYHEDSKSQRSCSCQLCKRQYDYSHSIYTSASNFTEDCECEPCECIKCGRDIKSDRYLSNISCQSVKSKPTYDINYRKEMLGTALPLIKKGEVLTPSTHRFKVQNQALRKQNSNALSVSVKEVMSNKKSPITIISHKLTNQSSRLSKQSSGMSPSIKIGSITKANISDTKKTQIINKNNSVDNEISSYFSGYSSFNTSPIASGHRKYGGSTSPMSRNKYKSWESSCNSSGHDYPEYLIQFPPSTLDTGLVDVIELNSNQTKTSEKSNLSPNSYSNYNIDKLSYDDVSIRENTTDKSSLLDTFKSEMTTNKKNDLKNSQNGQKYYDSHNNRDKISCFRDVPEHGVLASSQFYKLEMKHKSNYQKNQNIKSITNKDDLQDSTYFIDSRCSLKNDRKKTKDFNLINNFNNFYRAQKVFDSKIVQKKTASVVLPVHREVHNNNNKIWYPKCIPRPSLINYNTEIINAADFKRVRKTLKEAKEFSLELMRLLIMYENANKEFESISDKLKLSHACLISGDFEVRREENGDKTDVMKKKQDQEKCYNLIENALHGRRSEPQSAELNTDLQITTICKKNISNLEKVKREDDWSEDVAQTRKLNRLEEIELNLNRDEQSHNNMAKEKTSERIEAAENIEAEKDISDVSNRIAKNNEDIRKGEQINKKNYTKYKKPRRKVIISKKISVRNSNEMKAKSYIKQRITFGTSTTELSDSTSKSINEPHTKLSVNFSEKVDQQKNNAEEHYNNLTQIMKKIDSVFAGIEEIPITTSTETNEFHNHLDSYASNNTVKHEIKDTSPWPILRKNFSWSARPQTKSNVCNFPSLDLQIKQRVQSISQQTATPRKRRHENKALAITETKFEEIPESSYRRKLDKEARGSYAGTMKSKFEDTSGSFGSCWSMVDGGEGCSVENNIELEYEERPELVPTYSERVDRGVFCNLTNKLAPESKESVVFTFVLESCA